MMSENPMLSGAKPDTGDGGSASSYSAFHDDIRASIALDANTENNIFSESDWENLHLLSDYDPTLNGSLNPRYVSLKAKMQNELGISAVVREDGKVSKLKGTKYEYIHVPPSVVDGRVERILANEQEVLTKTRENNYYMPDNTCDDIITKHGEEILCKIRCVAILNSPQTEQDHHGDCRLYLTRHKRDDIIFHRIYFYAYGEAARYEAEESTEVVHKQWVELFENMTLLNVHEKYGLESHWTHTARRDVLAEFLTVSLDDVLSLHHRVCDYTEMRVFAKNDNVKDSQTIIGDCSKGCASCCPSLDCCSTSCAACLSCFPKEFAMFKLWKWSLKEERRIDLNSLICKEEKVLSTQPDTMVYDPHRKESMKMVSEIEKKTSSRRYHTLNLTCLDGFEVGRKYRTVIVLHPDEPTSQAIDFVCQVNSVIDEILDRKFKSFATHKGGGDIEAGGGGGELAYRNWILHLAMQNRRPFEENINLQARVRKLLGDIFSGGLYIEMEVSWPYYYNLILLIFFSFIGMIVCFAAAASNGLYAVNGIYGLLHWGNRLYNLQHKEYTASTLYKDVFVAFMGLLLAGISASLGPVNSTEAAGAGFTFMQAFFSFFGAVYQLYLYLQKRGGGNVFAPF